MRTTSIEERRPEVAEAAQALREQVDTLLDRVAERILKTPAAGSAPWHTMWRNRDSPAGEAQLRQHLLIRISVAQHLGLDTTNDVRAALAAGATCMDAAAAAAISNRPSTRRSHRPSRFDDLQLQLFDA